MMKISDALKVIYDGISNPCDGLPEDVFLFVSGITPMINVDLLIKDERNRTLLSWRDDTYCGTGWHVPGGIIRFKETIENRIIEVAKVEIGTPVEFEPGPVAICQTIIAESRTRGHFISLLFKCFLSEQFVLNSTGLSVNDAGFLAWHEKCPENLIPMQDMYRNYF
ncbi:MAG TPA: hypothetical protein PKW80_13265 [Bacteroidales bacterium]|nr:hypothetical protein [Bacteroidales bacterium]